MAPGSGEVLQTQIAVSVMCRVPVPWLHQPTKPNTTMGSSLLLLQGMQVWMISWISKGNSHCNSHALNLIRSCLLLGIRERERERQHNYFGPEPWIGEVSLSKVWTKKDSGKFAHWVGRCSNQLGTQSSIWGKPGDWKENTGILLDFNWHQSQRGTGWETPPAHNSFHMHSLECSPSSIQRNYFRGTEKKKAWKMCKT